ncbi:MAG: methyltransferase domain-containing protein [Bacteroidota bacterium]
MQRNAYKKRMKHYDDVLTGHRWWSHIYMKYLWRTDDNAIAREVLAMIPDDFRGKVLDVPVGTAVFTAEKYRRMTDAEIVGLDYSQEMLAIAGERAAQMQLRNLHLEQGTHDELLALGGIYKTMWDEYQKSVAWTV